MRKSAQTRQQRRQAAIKELAIHRTWHANLAKDASVLLGLLYNNPSSAYLNELLVGVLEQSSRSGCQIILEKCGARSERAVIEKLLRDGVGGIILPPPLSDSKVALEAQPPGFHSSPQRTPGSRRPAGAHQRLRGCRRNDTLPLCHWVTKKIGFILGAPNHRRPAANATQGLRRRCMRPPEVRRDWVKQGSFSYRSGLPRRRNCYWRAIIQVREDASNDDMAAAAIAVAHRQHLDVPADLLIVGFDDHAAGNNDLATLTTVRRPSPRWHARPWSCCWRKSDFEARGRTLSRYNTF